MVLLVLLVLMALMALMALALALALLLTASRLTVEVYEAVLPSCWTSTDAAAAGLEPSVSDPLAEPEADVDCAAAAATDELPATEVSEPDSDGLEPLLPADVSEPEADGLEPLPLPLPLPAPTVSAGEDEEDEVPAASATGQTVVATITTSVVTDPTLAGQSVTVAAHEVTV